LVVSTLYFSSVDWTVVSTSRVTKVRIRARLNPLGEV
jgi:hypothetical protein